MNERFSRQVFPKEKVSDISKPPFAIYVAWHPKFAEGAKVAESMYNQFRRPLFDNVSGGTGISVIYRSASVDGHTAPLPIEMKDGETTAIVVLADKNLCNDSGWTNYVRNLVDQAEEMGFGTRVFPVSMQDTTLDDLRLTEQALRWDCWAGCLERKLRKLNGKLTLEFCRMLRQIVEPPDSPNDGLSQYLKKVRVFLSHSKHDRFGKCMAYAIRDRIHEKHALSSFLDVHDIPAGLRFDKVLNHRVKSSAMIAIHSDSFSSREWCRREIILAKTYNVPLVVADCISGSDDRSFPYMGNVPIVRLETDDSDRMDFLVRRLLDEVLKNLLWRLRVQALGNQAAEGVTFTPRPPELFSLVNLSTAMGCSSDPVMVYPDPPLGNEEKDVFASVAPRVKLHCLSHWLAEVS